MKRLLARLRCFAIVFAAGIVLGGVAVADEGVQGAAIATAHPLATAAGYEALRKGGNAFDAAVAIAAMLAVVEPYSSGLGGGGFWLLHRARDGYQTMVDARETAPSGVTLSMYVDASGKPIPGATMRGGRAAAIPGMPAGIAHLAAGYGRLPLAVTLKAAIEVAREGFAVDARYAVMAKLREKYLASGINARVFLDGDTAPLPGFVLKQPQLAVTLQRIADDGRDGFYRGRIASEMVAAVNRAEGAWRAADLDNYRIVERAPVKFTYRGATIVTAPLPSAGGVILAEALNILEQFKITDAREPAQAHLVVEALRRGFEDRARYLGDGDFVKVPLARLLDKAYARERAAAIDPAAATPSDDGLFARGAADGRNTTHYSVIDGDGNRVAATLSINFLFGAGLVAGDTGVLLNNEMDDFSLRPDIANLYRLRGGDANAIAPGKRPLSSMSPTFVEDDKGVLAVGAPGGSRIVSQVLLAILDYTNQREVDLERIVSGPRYHHQYWPDRVELEPGGFAPEWVAALTARKHRVQTAGRRWGNMQAVFRARNAATPQAASDARGRDTAGSE
jgi:gamma-glutamyltranspeptidase/glutathione hydrolase